MTSMRKPGLAVALALVLVALPLAGCIGGQDQQPPPSTPPTGSPSTPPSNPSPGGNNNTPPPGPKPQDVNVSVSKNSNEARSPFSVPVEAATFKTFQVKLQISGFDNNPATAGVANIVLEVRDGNGTLVKSKDHRGAAGTTLTIDIAPSEAANLGDWSVAIIAKKEGSVDVPEGLYRFTLTIQILY